MTQEEKTLQDIFLAKTCELERLSTLIKEAQEERNLDFLRHNVTFFIAIFFSAHSLSYSLFCLKHWS